jgi:hypothetical protein
MMRRILSQEKKHMTIVKLEAVLVITGVEVLLLLPI